MRNQGVQLKFNPIVENLRGQRVVVVDDSIVRGTTTPRIVSLLREAGAREVHLRITSPPIVHPCYLGVDMATYAELIAANLTRRPDLRTRRRRFARLSQRRPSGRVDRTRSDRILSGMSHRRVPERARRSRRPAATASPR